MVRIRKFFFALATLIIGITLSAEPKTEHTYQLEPEETRPAATLSEASRLVGSGTGTALGQSFKEVWNVPSAGTK